MCIVVKNIFIETPQLYMPGKKKLEYKRVFFTLKDFCLTFHVEQKRKHGNSVVERVSKANRIVSGMVKVAGFCYRPIGGEYFYRTLFVDSFIVVTC